VWIGVWPGPNGFSGLLEGDWGWSFEFDKPVRDIVGDAVWLTLAVNLAVVIFVHVVAIPIAIYSAARQYSWGDYLVTFVGYIGLATPNFAGADPTLLFEPLVRHSHGRPLRSDLCQLAEHGQDPLPAAAPDRADPGDRARRLRR
jgi:ABC-type antimicrobial peptide transport system permease subunit